MSRPVGPVRISSCSEQNPPALAYSVADTDGKVELDGLDGELTSRQGME